MRCRSFRQQRLSWPRVDLFLATKRSRQFEVGLLPAFEEYGLGVILPIVVAIDLNEVGSCPTDQNTGRACSQSHQSRFADGLDPLHLVER